MKIGKSLAEPDLVPECRKVLADAGGQGRTPAAAEGRRGG